MRILVFEFMVGGGVADQHSLDSNSQEFLQQGHSMLRAVCEDLLELGHEVVTLLDSSVELPIPGGVDRILIDRENDVDPSLLGAAVNADYVLLIAPESDGILLRYAALLSSFADRFISPGIDFIRLTSNKWDCHRWLVDHGGPCPETILLEGDSDMIEQSFFPCVAKPVDGAGSEGVQLIQMRKELESLSRPILLQRFVEGVPASVSIIALPDDEPIVLEPGRQVFDADPFGVHLRTEFPLEPSLRRRAFALAQKVVNSLPATRGYFGIDMVLADDPNDDVVIEVNPRLTTSYTWLRKWNGENLAAKFPF